MWKKKRVFLPTYLYIFIFHSDYISLTSSNTSPLFLLHLPNFSCLSFTLLTAAVLITHLSTPPPPPTAASTCLQSPSLFLSFPLLDSLLSRASPGVSSSISSPWRVVFVASLAAAGSAGRRTPSPDWGRRRGGDNGGYGRAGWLWKWWSRQDRRGWYFFFSPRWHGLNPGRNGDGCVGSVRWGRAAPKNPPDLNHPAHCPFFVHLSHCHTWRHQQGQAAGVCGELEQPAAAGPRAGRCCGGGVTEAQEATLKKVAPDLLTRHRGNSCSSLQATPVLDEGQEEEQKKKKRKLWFKKLKENNW